MSSCGFNTHTWSWGQNMSMNQQETHSKKSDSTAQPSGKVREGRNRPSLRLTLIQKQKLKKCHKWATRWFPVNNWWPYWEEPKIPLQGNASKGFRRPEKSVSSLMTGLEHWPLYPRDSFTSPFWKVFRRKGMTHSPGTKALPLVSRARCQPLSCVHYSSKSLPRAIWQLDRWFYNSLLKRKRKVVWWLRVELPPIPFFKIRLKWFQCF